MIRDCRVIAAKVPPDPTDFASSTVLLRGPQGIFELARTAPDFVGAVEGPAFTQDEVDAYVVAHDAAHVPSVRATVRTIAWAVPARMREIVFDVLSTLGVPRWWNDSSGTPIVLDSVDAGPARWILHEQMVDLALRERTWQHAWDAWCLAPHRPSPLDTALLLWADAERGARFRAMDARSLGATHERAVDEIMRRGPPKRRW